MKKKLIVCMIAVLALIMFMPILTGCTKRENILKVYNCFDYIDEDVYDEFKEYYQQVTGEKIKVVASQYETNESMHSKIALKKSDYDVVVASEYMIERMIREQLLIPLNRELGNDIDGNPIENYFSNISPFFLSGSENFEYDEGNKYSTPYMWGTMGIVYAKDKISQEYLDSKGWDALWDTTYASRISMKDSVRDTFAIGALKVFKQELLNGTLKAGQVLNTTDADSITKIQQALIDQKRTVNCEYETDQGKSNIILNKVDMMLQWSGDAVYQMGELQTELGANRELGYYVPQEGSNLWVDSWAIPAYAKNQKAANLFINFLCREDIAIRNMDFIGYTTAVATEGVLEYAVGYYDDNDQYIAYTEQDYKDISDISFFFPTALQSQSASVRVNPAIFPDISVIKRCGVMRDFGDKTKVIDNLWTTLLSS